MAKNKQNSQNKKIDQVISKNNRVKKIIAASGALTAASVAIAPYLMKILKTQDIFINNFVASNVTGNTANFAFNLQGENKKIDAIVKKTDLELLFFDQNNVLIGKTPVRYDQSSEKFRAFYDRFDAGSLYSMQIIAPNYGRYNFIFNTNSANYFSTTSQVENIDYVSKLNKSDVVLTINDSQNLLTNNANIFVKYNLEGSAQMLEAQAKVESKIVNGLPDPKIKYATFALDNLQRGVRYHISQIYYQDGNKDFDLTSSPSVIKEFNTQVPTGSLANLVQKTIGRGQAGLNLAFTSNDPDLAGKNVVVEYYYQNNSGSYSFGRSKSLTIKGHAGDYHIDGLQLSKLAGGQKFFISRIIGSDNNSVDINVKPNFSFASAPEISKIRITTQNDSYTRFDVTFQDASLLLNGQNVQIDFKSLRDQSNHSVIGTVVGNKFVGFAENLPRFTTFLISNARAVSKAQLFSEDGQDTLVSLDDKPIFFGDNVTEQEREFTTRVSYAEADKVIINPVGETSAQVTVEYGSIDDYLLNQQATLFYSVQGTSNVLKSNIAPIVAAEDGKVKVTWNLVNLESGAKYNLSSITFSKADGSGYGDFASVFAKSIIGQDLEFATKPSLSNIFSAEQAGSKVSITMLLQNAINHFSGANIYYREYTPGTSGANVGEWEESDKKIEAQVFNDISIKGLTSDALEKGKNYIITKVEMIGGNYQSSKGSTDILPVSRNIDLPDRIFSVSAPITVTSIQQVSDTVNSAKIRVNFDNPSINIIGSDPITITYYRAGTNEILTKTATIAQGTRYADFQLDDLAIGSKYYLNSVKIRKTLINDRVVGTVYKNVAALYADSVDVEQRSFYTTSGVIKVVYDNSREGSVYADFYLADARGDYKGATAKLKYGLVQQDKALYDEQATHATTLADTIVDGVSQSGGKRRTRRAAVQPVLNKESQNFQVLGNRIRVDLTGLVKKGEYEINTNSLELVSAPDAREKDNSINKDAKRLTQTNAPIPFKAELLDNVENNTFDTIPKTATITSISQSEVRNKGAKFSIEFATADSYLYNGTRIKVKLQKVGADGDPIEVTGIVKNENGKQQVDFNTDDNLLQGSRYQLVSFHREDHPEEKIEIVNGDSVQFTSQFVNTEAAVKSISYTNIDETKARINLELEDQGQRVEDNAKVKIKLKYQHYDPQTNQQHFVDKELEATTSSISNFYSFNLNGLDKATRYQIESISFEKPTTQGQQVANPIDLHDLEATETELNSEKQFTTQGKTVTVNAIDVTNIQPNSAQLALTFADSDRILLREQQNTQQKVQISYKNLNSDEVSTETVDMSVDNIGDKGEVQLTGLEDGSQYQITKVSLIDNDDIKFGFDDSTGSRAGIDKQLFTTTPTYSTASAKSVTEHSGQITIDLHDKAGQLDGLPLEVFYQKLGDDGRLEGVAQKTTVTVNGAKAVVDLSNLDRIATYVVTGIKYKDKVGSTSFIDLQKYPTTTSDSKVIKLHLIAQSTTIENVSYTSSDTNASATIDFDPNDAKFLEGRRFNVELESLDNHKVSAIGVVGSGQHSITISASSLKNATYYNIVQVTDITDIPESESSTKQKLTTINFTTDARKKAYLATKPEITNIRVSSISERKYAISMLVKDPLRSNTQDVGGKFESFNGRVVEIKYKEISGADVAASGAQHQVEQTTEGTIKNGQIYVEIDSLTKGATYKIESVEFKAGENDKIANAENSWTSKNQLWIEDNVNFANPKSTTYTATNKDSLNFTITPITATITDIEQETYSPTDVKVKIKFENPEDKFLTSENKTLQLSYQGIGGAAQTTNLTKANDGSYEATINSGLSYGSIYNIVGITDNTGSTSDGRLQTINYATKVLANRKFVTQPEISSFSAFAVPGDDTKQKIRIDFKDQGGVLDNGEYTLHFIDTNNIDQPDQNDSTNQKTQDLTITDGVAIGELSNLAKYGIYKIVNITPKSLTRQRRSATSPKFTEIPLASTFATDRQKEFTNWPQKLEIKKVEAQPNQDVHGQGKEKLSISVTLDQSYRRYLKQFGTSGNVRIGIVTPDGVEISTRKNDFENTGSDFNVSSPGVDPTLTYTWNDFNKDINDMAKFEIKDLTFTQDTNNLPVEFKFDNNFNYQDLFFTTTPIIDSIQAVPLSENDGQFIVDIQDEFGSFIGKTLEITYGKVSGTSVIDTHTSRTILFASKNASQTHDATLVSGKYKLSQAIFHITSLAKFTDYKIQSMKFINPKNSQETLGNANDSTTRAAELVLPTTNNENPVLQTLANSFAVTSIEQLNANALNKSEATVKIHFNGTTDAWLNTKHQALYLRYKSLKDGQVYVSTTTSIARQNYFEYQLSNLEAGTKYEIVSLSQTQSINDNDIRVTLPTISGANKTFETLPTIKGVTYTPHPDQNKVNIKFQLENTAGIDLLANAQTHTLNVRVVEANNVGHATNVGIPLTTQTVIGDNGHKTISFDLSTGTNIYVGNFYKIESVTLNGNNLEFSQSVTDNDKTFDTGIGKTSVIQVASSAQTYNSGTFKIKFNEHDKFLIGNYQAKIKYGTPDNSPISDLTTQTIAIDNSNFTNGIDFALSNLVAGQQYSIKDVYVERVSGKNYLHGIFLPEKLSVQQYRSVASGSASASTSDPSKLLTDVDIESIYTTSEEQGKAKISVHFRNDNNQLQEMLKTHDLKLTYKLYDAGNTIFEQYIGYQEWKSSHATGAVTIDSVRGLKGNGQSQNVVEFSIDNLFKGAQYYVDKVEFIQKGGGTQNSENITFESTLSTNDKRAFTVMANTAIINEVQSDFQQSTNTTANVTINFDKDDVFLAEKKVALEYYDESFPDTKYYSQSVTTIKNGSNNVSATFALAGLLPGKSYKVATAIVGDESITINLNNSLKSSNNDLIKFQTAAQINSITVSNIHDTSANIVLNVTNEFTSSILKYTDSDKVSIVLQPKNIITQTTPGVATEKMVEAHFSNSGKTITVPASSLQQFTRYYIKSISIIPEGAYADKKNRQIYFSPSVETSDIINHSRYFETTGSSINLDTSYSSDGFTNGYKYTSLSTTSAELQFKIDAIGQAIGRGKNYILQIDSADPAQSSSAVHRTNYSSAIDSQGMLSFMVDKNNTNQFLGVGQKYKVVSIIESSSSSSISGVNDKLFATNYDDVKVVDVTQDAESASDDSNPYKYYIKFKFNFTNPNIIDPQRISQILYIQYYDYDELNWKNLFANWDDASQSYKLEVDDVRVLIGKELWLSIYNFTQKTNPLSTTLDKSERLDQLESGLRISTTLDSNYLIEGAVSTDVSIPDLIGFTLAVYDPTNSFQKLQPVSSINALNGNRYYMIPYDENIFKVPDTFTLIKTDNGKRSSDREKHVNSWEYFFNPPQIIHGREPEVHATENNDWKNSIDLGDQQNRAHHLFNSTNILNNAHTKISGQFYYFDLKFYSASAGIQNLTNQSKKNITIKPKYLRFDSVSSTDYTPFKDHTSLVTFYYDYEHFKNDFPSSSFIKMNLNGFEILGKQAFVKKTSRREDTKVSNNKWFTYPQYDKNRFVINELSEANNRSSNFMNSQPIFISDDGSQYPYINLKVYNPYEKNLALLYRSDPSFNINPYFALQESKYELKDGDNPIFSVKISNQRWSALFNSIKNNRGRSRKNSSDFFSLYAVFLDYDGNIYFAGDEHGHATSPSATATQQGRWIDFYLKPPLEQMGYKTDSRLNNPNNPLIFLGIWGRYSNSKSTDAKLRTIYYKPELYAQNRAFLITPYIRN